MTTTLRPFDITRQRPLSRSILREWRSGEVSVKPTETRPTETVLVFSVRHSKEAKAFIASLSPHEYGDGFSTWMSDNPGVQILSERVGRYSEKALIEFSKRAYEHLLANADDPRVSHYLDQIPDIKES